MRRTAGRRGVATWVAALVIASSSGALLASPGQAGASAVVTLYVNGTSGTATTGCAGPGTTACQTIQEGVTAAEALGDDDAVTVTVAAMAEGYSYGGGVIVNAADLASLTVEGGGASTTAVSGEGMERDFTVESGTVTLRDLSIDNGFSEDGGGVAATELELAISLIGDTLSNDSAAGLGGALFTVGEETGMVLTSDTFSDDTAEYGGAVFVQDELFRGVMRLSNDTFSDDRASQSGGGLFLIGPEETVQTLEDVTFSDDTARAGGGIDNESLPLTVSDSIFDAATCLGPIEAEYNVVTRTSGCPSGSGVTTTGSRIGLTSTLGENGSSGPETLALRPTSPAIDEVPQAACTIRTDERGEPRPGIQGQTSCDAGAYEYQAVPPSSSTDCIPDAQACSSASSTPHGSKAVTSDQITVTATGRGTVAAGTYRRDPAGPLASATDKYFGVSLLSGNGIESLVVKDCDLGGGTTLEWWNGHSWLPVVSDAGTTYTSTCITVTLGATSSPSLATIAKLSRLSRFEAVVFGVT